MSPEDKSGSWTGAVLAMVATAAVYFLAGVADFGFVNYDDPLVVHENPVDGWGSLGAAFTGTMANAWLPLYALSTAFDNLVFGADSPGAYHVHSLLWHLLNVLLVWLVSRRLGLGGMAATAAALVFGLHPAVTESVAWVASRKDLVSFAFAAAAGLVYLGAEGDSRRPTRHWLGAGLLGLGLLAKGTVVILPGLLALHALARSGDAARRREALKGVIPYAVVALVLTVVHILVAREMGTMGASAASGDGILTRVVAGLAALFTYLRLLVVPTGLSVEHGLVPGEGLAGPAVAGGLVLAAVVSATVVLYRRGHRGAAAALVGILVALAPFNAVFPRTSVILAERYLYVAAAVAAGLAGLALHRASVALKAGPAPVIVVAAILGFLTWQRLPVWQDSLTLWTDAVAQAPQAHIAHAKLGESQAEAALGSRDPDFRRERFAEAAASHARAADLARTPLEELRSRQALGVVLLGLDRKQEALAALDRAMSLVDTVGDTAKRGFRIGLAVNHAKALEAAGRRDDAADALRALVLRWPEAGPAWMNLGILLRDAGDLAGAREALEQAVAVEPNLVEARLARVDLEALAGDFASALREAVRAVESAPDNAAALVKAGEVASLLGQPLRAEVWFRRAHELDADDPAARRGLAGTLLHRAGTALSRGEAAEALKIARTATELDPEGAATWFMLGDAERAAGLESTADRAYLEALKLGGEDRARSSLGALYLSMAAARWAVEDTEAARERVEQAVAIRPARIQIARDLPVLEEGLDRIPEAPVGGEARAYVLDGLLELARGETGAAVAALSTGIGLARFGEGDEAAMLPAALVFRSRARMLDGDIDTAVEDLRALVETLPEDAGARFLLGHALSARSGHRRDLGKKKAADEDAIEAVAVLEKSRTMDPAMEEASIALAELHFTRRRLVDSIRELNGVLQRDPTRVEAHLVMANIMKTQFAETEESTYLQEAESSFRKALGIDPREARALTGLGEVAAYAGKARDALTYALRALAVDPDLKQARSLAAVLFVRSGRASLDSGNLEAAEAAIARVDELDGETAPLCLLRAEVHRARGRWVEAGVEIERARSLAPRDPDVRDAVATHYRDVGYAFLLRKAADEAQRHHYRVQAEEAFRRAVAADPPRVELDEVRRLLERGMDAPEALRGSKELVEAFDRALEAARALVDEGAAALSAGDPETARKKFRESLRNYESPNARFGLGVALSALERGEEAERAYEMAVGVDPRYARAWMNLGGLRYRRGDWTGAEEAYMEFLHNAPTDTDVSVVEQVQTLVLSCRREIAKSMEDAPDEEEE